MYILSKGTYIDLRQTDSDERDFGCGDIIYQLLITLGAVVLSGTVPFKRQEKCMDNFRQLKRRKENLQRRQKPVFY